MLMKPVILHQRLQNYDSGCVVIEMCDHIGPDPPHGYSDSSDMVWTILQMVQNQDRVLKDLYSHLRYSLQDKHENSSGESFYISMFNF